MKYHPHFFVNIFLSHHGPFLFFGQNLQIHRGWPKYVFMLTISLSRTFIAPHSMLLYFISACSGHSRNVSFKFCDSFWYSFYHIKCFMDSTCNSSCWQNTWKIRYLCESYLLSNQRISFIIPNLQWQRTKYMEDHTTLWNFLFITSTGFLHYANLICSVRPEHCHVNP